jgi:hypothetical protein
VWYEPVYFAQCRQVETLPALKGVGVQRLRGQTAISHRVGSSQQCNAISKNVNEVIYALGSVRPGLGTQLVSRLDNCRGGGEHASELR